MARVRPGRDGVFPEFRVDIERGPSWQSLGSVSFIKSGKFKTRYGRPWVLVLKTPRRSGTCKSHLGPSMGYVVDCAQLSNRNLPLVDRMLLFWCARTAGNVKAACRGATGMVVSLSRSYSYREGGREGDKERGRGAEGGREKLM